MQNPLVDDYQMWIIFLIDPSGVRHAVEMMSSEFTVDAMLKKSAAATGIAVENQCLAYGERELKPGRPLTSYGVQHGSEIVIRSDVKTTRQARTMRRATPTSIDNARVRI